MNRWRAMWMHLRCLWRKIQASPELRFHTDAIQRELRIYRK